MHNATAITTGSANQRPNTPCIRLWIDVTFRGLEDSYMVVILICHYYFMVDIGKTYKMMHNNDPA